MKTLIILIGVFFSLSLFSGVRGLFCYRCAYIEGINGGLLTYDCLLNVQSSGIPLEEGQACMKAEGFISGKYFVVRGAFRQNAVGTSGFYPSTQDAITCAQFDDLENGLSNGGSPYATLGLGIGNRFADGVTSCHICQDQNECNGVGNVKPWVIFMGVMSLAIFCFN